MTPTIDPPPELLDEIKALFSWNPPRLIPAPNKKSSTASASTRPSSFYNKHFSSQLVLKRVARLPSLVRDLAQNVDKALDAALTTLPSLDGFITAKQRAYQLRSLNQIMTDEEAVGIFYDKTTATYCSQVASTLALHPFASSSDWRSLLFWAQSGRSSDRAIMDGRLCFMREEDVDTTDKTWAVAVESMESEKRRIFEEMGKSKSALATWGIKSTSADTAEVMNAVLTLGKFPWMFCNASCCRSTSPKHLQAKVNVKGVLVGRDAQAPPWTLPDDPLDTSLIRDEEICIQLTGTLQRPVTRQVTRSATSGSSKHGSPTKCRGKKRKRDEEEEEHEMTLQNLVQQTWAQAVRVDGTLIILHSGNHELLCVRHRGSQTLYVSDLIEPPTCVNPGYGKLHVGIYFAAVQDALDRKQKLSPISQSEPPYNGGDLTGGDEVGKRKSSGLAAGRKVLTDDELVAIEKTMHAASNRDVVLLYLQYDVYDSPIPASFLRAAPSIMAHTRGPTPPFSPRDIRTYGLEECLTIILTSEIGRGATGVVHRGTLKPEICNSAMPLDVVVKLAFDTEQRDALRTEYEVYCRLKSKGVQGIATVLGLFDDSEDGACALVMLYAGVPLVKKPQRILSVSDRKSALSTLKSIHRAGILHGDIRRDNILMGDSGVTIIDFGHSEQCDNQKAKDKEIARLRYLLGFKSLANAVVPRT